jgi:hypothetical protein
METNFVKKSIVIKTSIDNIWNYLSKITSLCWLENQKSAKFLSEKKRGVGAIRLISFDDGSNIEEHIVGWRPKKYFSYIVTSGLPVDAYHATISLTQIDNSIKLTWESFFSSKGTKSEIGEFTEFLSRFYVLSLKNLKSELEK